MCVCVYTYTLTPVATIRTTLAHSSYNNFKNPNFAIVREREKPRACIAGSLTLYVRV